MSDISTMPAPPSPTEREPLDLREKTLNRQFRALAGPAIADNLLMSMVFFADTLIIARLRSAESLAAAALAGVLMYLVQSPFFALGAATVSLVSRYWGERDYERARGYVGHVLGAAAVFAAVTCAAGWWLAPALLSGLGASPDVATLGVRYLRIIFLSGLAGIPLIIANSAIRAVGNTSSPMTITLLVNVVNIVVSVVLAFGWGPIPAFHLYGVALGTVVARTLGCTLSVAVMASHGLGLGFRWRHLVNTRLSACREIWALAAPAVAERLLHTGAHALFMRIVAALGTTALAAHTIALHVESLAFMPAVGFGMATATIVGQAIGARRPQIAELAIRLSTRWAGLLMCVISTVFVLGAPAGIIIFQATPEVRRLAAVALQVGALELPFLAIGIILANALRAAGDTRSPLYTTFACVLLFRLALVYWLGIRLEWGLPGIWLATAVDWAARAAGMWVFFTRGKWKTIHARNAGVRN